MREFVGYQKGVNLGGWLSQCDHTKEHYDTFIGEEDIKRIASWDLDHVRVPVDYELIEKEEGIYSEEGYAYIDKCLKWCRKYGLNMILDLHKTAGYVFDEQINNGTDKADSFFENDGLKQRFLNLWVNIASRYKDYCDILAFEILNEIVDTSGGIAWNKLAKRTYDIIRPIVPDAIIVIGSINWNSLHTLPLMEAPYDDKVVYTFHFYDPMLFTHQKAHWMDAMPKDKDTSYPGTMEQYRKEMEALGDMNGSLFEVDTAMVDNTFMDALIHMAVTVGEKLSVPLYCGEYGVIDQAPIVDTLRWYQDFHSVLTKYKIGRAAWTYKEKDFGIIGPHYASIQDQLIKCL